MTEQDVPQFYGIVDSNNNDDNSVYSYWLCVLLVQKRALGIRIVISVFPPMRMRIIHVLCGVCLRASPLAREGFARVADDSFGSMLSPHAILNVEDLNRRFLLLDLIREPHKDHHVEMEFAQ